MAQHISVRVPWHDNYYNGTVCTNPVGNSYCQVLKNIMENKNVDEENNIAGQLFNECSNKPVCLSEGACFMSPKEISKLVHHPYNNNETHKHFLETEQKYLPYSIPGRPYRWLMHNINKEKNPVFSINNIDIDYDKENIQLSFKTNWMQHTENHIRIFRQFYKNVNNNSLCLIYAKRTPMSEDTGRVIIGIGKVAKVNMPVPHNTNDENNPLQSLTWEAMIEHTIREDGTNGFLFPYHDLLEYAKNHEDIDLDDYIVFAPSEYFNDFSYATEHVNYDAVIIVLKDSIELFKKLKNIMPERIDEWNDKIQWLEKELVEVWKDRGLFPNLGKMLYMLGFENGLDLAEEIKNYAKDNNVSIWNIIDKIIMFPQEYLPKDIADAVKANKEAVYNFKGMDKEYLKLLSQFSLSFEQIKNIINKHKDGVKEIIQNPYLLYEKTRYLDNSQVIYNMQIDLGIFVDDIIKTDECFDIDEGDERRIRAFTIEVLEEARDEGHSVLPINMALQHIKDKINNNKLSENYFQGVKEYFEQEILYKTYNNTLFFKLQESENIKNTIIEQINIRLKKKYDIDDNWSDIVKQVIAATNENVKMSHTEELAQKEKATIAERMACASIYALEGGAGTGKSTLISILASSEKIKSGGILVLAPTGKAKVKVQQYLKDNHIDATAYTVAQFLLQKELRAYNIYTGRHSIPSRPLNTVETVVIDECSMLTEEMMAALLKALSNTKRIILAGDPNQLPPIGMGRPFVDIINYLKEQNNTSNQFPIAFNNYGKLTISRRQQNDNGENRYDVELANFFKADIEESDDSIFSKISLGQDNKSFKLYQINPEENFDEQLLNIINTELKSTIDNGNSLNEQEVFDTSLGAIFKEYGGNRYTFFSSYSKQNFTKYIDKWQIIAPIKNYDVGVYNINSIIHNTYRKDRINEAKDTSKMHISLPYGSDQIVYGDKVINNINTKDINVWPKDKEQYIANGEVGIVCDNSYVAQSKNSKPKKPKYIDVRFSTQNECSYRFNTKNSDEGDEQLSLAYAITVHKSQGSEFGLVFFVLQDPCFLLSRELLYTALTRQKDRVILIYNGDIHALRKYSSDYYSDIIRRYTDLFMEPSIIEFNGRFFEENLIHKTENNELVRSKSEVIVANALYNAGYSYEYEKALVLSDGNTIYPDFTINYFGTEFYLEHCGMLYNPAYKARWEVKLQKYKDNGLINQLIVTEDNLDGGIDSKKILEIIKDKLS